jgi:hypothetical protein
MTPAERVAKVLSGAYRSGVWWRSRCPVHGSRGSTLALLDGDHGLVAHCHAGCDRQDILAELRRRGLLNNDGGRARAYRPDPDEMARLREVEAADRRRRSPWPSTSGVRAIRQPEQSTRATCARAASLSSQQRHFGCTACTALTGGIRAASGNGRARRARGARSGGRPSHLSGDRWIE